MKIKILKIEKDQNYCYECDTSSRNFHSVTNWDEVDTETYDKLVNAINSANQNRKDSYHYMILTQVDDYQDIFKSADEFIKYQEEQKKKEEKRAIEYKKCQEQLKLERKRKQLEKLQKELSEN